MTDAIPTFLTATASACGVLVSAMLMIGTAVSGNLKEKINKRFFLLLAFCLVGSGCEALTAFLFGTPGKELAILISIVDFINYVCGAAMIMGLAMYLYEFLSIKGVVSRKPIRFVVAITLLHIAVIAAAQSTGVFAALDAWNHYIVQDAFWMTFIAPVVSIIVLTALVLRNLQLLKRRESVSLLIYMTLPILCYALELLFPGAWIAYLGSAIALFLIYINIQVDLSTQLREKEAELTESRVAIMLTQIQPHFLHNSLLSIQYLCRRDPEQAEAAVRDFSKYLRGNLGALTNKQLISFEQELAHVRVYLSLEERRFEERLRIAFDIQADGFRLPALTVQPIVENAIQHGVTKRYEGGTVSIRARQEADCYTITVEDDGVGFDLSTLPQHSDAHVGLGNVRYRLEAMCGGWLDIDSTPNVGTTVTIKIPKGDLSE